MPWSSRSWPPASPLPPESTSAKGSALLVLDREAAELLLAFERDLEPCLAAGSGDLAHLAGWAQPIGADNFAGAIRLADYLVEHARVAFDLMGADPRLEEARWLLDWINRTGRTQFSRRDAHAAAPRGCFRKATDLEPALALLEEHGWLRRVDADPSGPKGGRPASPRFLINPLPHATEPTKPHRSEVLWVL
jgi:hypothetical protein